MPAATRQSTGVPGLDAILQGGLVTGDTYLVAGPPGAGKTTLAGQFVFTHAASGAEAVYVTLLAEAPEQLLAHLANFRYYDLAVVSRNLNYYSGYTALAETGLDGLRQFLWRVLRDRHVSYLVVDGFDQVRDVAPSRAAFVRFVHDLGQQARLLGCTTLLLTQLDAPAGHPEYTIVDGVIELRTRTVDVRSVRELQVLKLRGSGFWEGLHELAITDAGVVVYPRTEARFAAAGPGFWDAASQVSSGVPVLDDMLAGGVHRGTSTMLLGTPGAGKTPLGLAFLTAGARQGEPGVHFGFYETEPQLVAMGDTLGFGTTGMLARGLLTIRWQPSLEQGLDALADALLTTVTETRAQRVFIDGYEGFVQAATEPQRTSRFFTAMTNALRSRGVTTLLSAELRGWVGPALEAPMHGVASIAKTVIFVRHVEFEGRLRRVLSVLKQRGRSADGALREVTISERGIEVASALDAAVGLLTGIAQPRHD